VASAYPCLYPLIRGTESGLGVVQAGWFTACALFNQYVHFGGGTVLGENVCLIWIWIALGDKC